MYVISKAGWETVLRISNEFKIEPQAYSEIFQKRKKPEINKPSQLTWRY